jgi:LemA protein
MIGSFFGTWGPTIIIGVLVLILAIWGIVIYNRLVAARNSSKEALRGIDVALETRFDQIKAQADAASGIVQQEVDLILNTTALRTGRTISQLEVREKAELTAAMQDAEQKMLQELPALPGSAASIENYPKMETYKNVVLLQRTINEAEERLQAARRVYNRAATEYNTRRQAFPTVLIAGVLGFREHELFELTDQRKKEQYNLEGFLDS